jgi:hypothetical protein
LNRTDTLTEDDGRTAGRQTDHHGQDRQDHLIVAAEANQRIEQESDGNAPVWHILRVLLSRPFNV